MLRAIAATCLLLFIFQSNSIAQTFTYPGFIVKKNGETVKGVIGISNTERTIREITFKSGDKTETFNATDITAFGRDNIDYRVGATVSYHMNSLDLDVASREFSDKTNTETVFLQEIIKGKVSLYELETDIRKYYFVRKENGPITELIGRFKIDESNSRIEDTQYKNMLIAYANEFGADQSVVGLISSMSYNESEIKRVVLKINGGKNESTVVKNTMIKSSSIEIGVGGIMTNFSAHSIRSNQGLDDMLAATPYESSTSPRINVALQFASNIRYRKLKGILALGYSSATFKGSSPNIAPPSGSPNQADFLKKFNFLDISLGGILSFTPLAKSTFFVQPFITTLFITNGTAVANTSIISKYPYFDSPNTGLGASLGFTSGQHRIELRGEYILNNYSNDYVKIRSTRISLNYHYTVFRF